MSSHDCSVRTTIKTKAGTTLQQVFAVLQLFSEEFDCRLAGEMGAEPTGEVPFEERDNEAVLDTQGILFVYLCFQGPGHGTVPEWIDSLCLKLEEFVADGGASVEIIDHDLSASNYEALSYRFLGANDHERIRARLTLGLETAQEFLVDVLGPDGFAKVEQLARQLGDERLARANAA